MFSLTTSFIVIFIFGKLTFLGTKLNLMMVMVCSEKQALPCYRAATSLRSLSAQVALRCTEQIGFISDLPCHWVLVRKPLGSWTIISPCPHSAGLNGAPQLQGENTVPACLDTTCAPFPCQEAQSVHWHQGFYQAFVLWHAVLYSNLILWTIFS